MTTKNYEKYISSPEWSARRMSYFETYVKRCCRCLSTHNIHLHHLTYERFTRELDSDLMPLCQGCHELVHQRFKNPRNRRTLEEVSRDIVRDKSPGSKRPIEMKGKQKIVVQNNERLEDHRSHKLLKKQERKQLEHQKQINARVRRQAKKEGRVAFYKKALVKEGLNGKVYYSASRRKSKKDVHELKQEAHRVSRKLATYQGSDSFLLAMKEESQRLPSVFEFNGWRPSADQMKRMIELLP